ncbi:MAG: cellulase family glycosylhydrolase [Colwellia sp.]
MIKGKIKPLRRAILLSLLGVAGSYASAVQAAQCEHVIQSDWPTGFVAEIRITNDGTAPIDGWEVQWSYDDAVANNIWNANVSGSNPYTASNLSWNSSIAPGSSIVFGLQGSKSVANSTAPVALVTGDICGELAPVDSDNDGVIDELDQCPDTPAGDTVDELGCTVFLDADEDGVEDAVDQCPDTPVGDEVDALGCTILPDTDNDGINDTIDECPDTPAGEEVDALGCTLLPIIDDDNDGIANEIDECPDTPAGTAVDATGCEVEGTFRVDATGNITKNGTILPVQCGNWFGLEGQHEPSDSANNPGGAPMELYVGNMWWANSGEGTDRTIQQTMDEIKAQGINVIRLPIAPQTLDETDAQGIGFVSDGGVLKNHESVRQTNARQAMVDFIKQADENDLQVIIDIHSCSNYLGWRAGKLDSIPPYADKDRVGYDYTREDYACAEAGDGVTVHEYNEEIWLDNLREIAGLSAEIGVDNIMGIDIFNEPWDYTWEDWKTLSEHAYEAINEVNPDILIFVEGISGGTSDGIEVPHGDETSNPNWGENFYEHQTNPLNIPKNRLVLSPHTYGPSVFAQEHFMDPTQPECEGLSGDEAGEADCNLVIDAEKLYAGWDEHFGYLREQGYAMVIGEFGGNMDWPNNSRIAEQEMWSHIEPGIDQVWQNTLVDYMKDKDIQGCYWSINPESGDTGGIYLHAYDPIDNTSDWGFWLDFDERKIDLLQWLWAE